MRRRPSFKRIDRAILVAAMAVVSLPAASSLAGTLERVEPTTTLLGSYLAGRIAKANHDTSAAAEFYRQALTRDPASDLVVEQSFLMESAEGNGEVATELARRLLGQQGSHRLARTWLGVQAFKARKFDEAEEQLRLAGGGPIGELTATLARAWVKLAQGNSGGALAMLDGGRTADAVRYYYQYHRAMISDLAGRRSEARKSYEALFKQDARTPRTALAFAQHAANSGDLKLARGILKEHLDKTGSEGHPMVRALSAQLNGNEVVPLLIESPEQGFAEVFYGLGEALASEGGVGLGAMYLQMALAVRPTSPFTLAALANVYETTKRYDAAIEVYGRIPRGTPLESAVEIRKAVNLNLLDRVDDAKHMLERLAAEQPDDVRPLVALGDIMRSHKRFGEAVEYYTRVIALTPKPEPRHWTYWYSRGTSYERMKKWPQAEADLLKSLQLSPDQPLTLNYLGYSWIDQSRNLKQGLAMIEKAVAKKPDDGYIVDSLGWAHYRLGNFREAVRFLERAVELRPEDPVLNDHLGDAYWRVGRQREARFQWDQALTLKPEAEDAEKIQRKLKHGLPSPPIARVPRKTKEAAKPETPKKRVETQLAPSTPLQ